MTDEISIQQSQSNAGAYGIGGALLGGAAGGVGAHYLTRPKYGSYEDIIKEAKDTAEFSKKIEKAEGKEKEFLEKVKALAAKEETAGAEWDRLLAEYQEAHKGEGEIKTDSEEYKKYNQQKTDLETKRTEAIKKAEADLKANNTGGYVGDRAKLADPTKLEEAKAKVEQAVKGVETRKSQYIANRQKDINTFNRMLKVKTGNKVEQLALEKINFENTVESIQKHLKDKKFKKNSELTFIPDKGPDKGTTVTRIPADEHELKLAKQYFEKQYQTKLDAIFPNIKDAGVREALMKDGYETIQNLRTVNENMDSRIAFVKKQVQDLEKAEAIVNDKTEIKSVVGKAAKKAPKSSKIAKDFAEYTTRDFNAEIAALDPKKDASKIADLRRMQTNLETSIMGHYNTIMQNDIGKKAAELDTQKLYRDILRSEELIDAHNSRVGTSPKNIWRKIGRSIGSWLGVKPSYLNAAENQELEEIGQRLKAYRDSLPEATREKEYEKLVQDAEKLKLDDVKTNIQNLQGELDTLNEAKDKRVKAQAEVRKINAKLEQVGAKGAKVNAAGKVILNGKMYQPTLPFNLATEVSVPATDPYITRLENTIAKIKESILPNGTVYTDEQITQMAKEKVEKELAEEAKALEEARGKLPKGEAKTAEQLKADFIKNKGERKAFIDTAVKDAEKGFKDECKEWFQRRFGFAEHTNLKIAGAAVAGAALIGGIAAMLAPKKDKA